MLFFALIAIITVFAKFASRLGAPGVEHWRGCMRWGLLLALAFAGIDHILTPERYLPMMPSFVPFHAEVIFLTGLCELAGAVGLLLPRLRYLAGIMLAIYFVCVFPANIKNAIEGLSVEGLPTATWYYWVRLVFQPLVVWWTLYSSGVLAPSPSNDATSNRQLSKALTLLGRHTRRNAFDAARSKSGTRLKSSALQRFRQLSEVLDTPSLFPRVRPHSTFGRENRPT